MIVETKSVKETIELGKRIGKLLVAGDVVALIGKLGSGKTTLTQGLARGLGVKKKDYVTSPSFTLIKEHKGRVPIYHVDLYRIDNPREVYDLGYEEYFYGEGVTIIEWAEKIRKLLPKEALIINLEIIDENKNLAFGENLVTYWTKPWARRNRRRIELKPKGKHYRDIVKKIRQGGNV